MNDDDFDALFGDEDDGQTESGNGPRPADPLGTLRDLAGDDPRVQAGIEHLQRAAREAIAASRALLDVAEDLVEEPGAVGGLLDLLGGVGGLATRLGAAGRGGVSGDGVYRGSARSSGEDDDDDPPVQRIPVS